MRLGQFVKKKKKNPARKALRACVQCVGFSVDHVSEPLIQGAACAFNSSLEETRAELRSQGADECWENRHKLEGGRSLSRLLQ